MCRVVVTGLGIVCPAGNSLAGAWSTVVEGRPATRQITSFDTSTLPVRIGAEIQDFDPVAHLGAKEARRTARFVQLAAVSAKQALDESGLEPEGSDRYGCIFGVGLGAAEEFESQSEVLRMAGPRKVSPMLMPTAIPNMATGYVSIQRQLRGVNLGISTACASGTHAIGEAYVHIVAGQADAIVAGGAESVFTPIILAAFARMGALSTRNEAPSEASRPFDNDRDGFVIGEGAAALVLESYEHARRRGAKIYAELAGYGASSDAYHVTSPSPEGEGAARAMRYALESARLNAVDIDYINAHGSSTKANDATESTAIQSAFGPHARTVAISSTKGVTGHCLGAAGAIEAVFSILAIRDGIAPPTANYSAPDPSCPLNYTPNVARELRIRNVLSNSFGFGGQNACIVLSKFDE